MYKLFSLKSLSLPRSTSTFKIALPKSFLYSNIIKAQAATKNITTCSILRLQPKFYSSAVQNAEAVSPNLNPVEKNGVIYNNFSEEIQDEYQPVPFTTYTSINKNTMKAIKSVFGFDHASKVQDSIISTLPSEKDFMIKAKTGTGKTIAFLISAIETLLKNKSASVEDAKPGVGILIVSPTRELARQISEEAKRLVKFHKFSVHLLVGGESSRNQSRDLRYSTPDIVVATPGRLLDMWENDQSFGNAANKTQVLIFDEADMLLDMGFQTEINQIIKKCPENRQNFLVSATFSKKVAQVANETFRGKKFEVLDCVDSKDTNVVHKVKQSYILVDWDIQFAAIYHALKSQINNHINNEGRGTKIIVFLPTTKATQVYSDIIKSILGSKGQTEARGNDRNKRYGSSRAVFGKTSGAVEIFCLHGKKSQDTRSRISEKFRNFDTNNNNTAILITTDVSARGVDYPGTEFVLQVGVPKTTEQYTHRVGRTGRAGKSGEGLIILSPSEIQFLKELEFDQGAIVPQNEEFSPETLAQIKVALNQIKKNQSKVTEENDSTETKDNESISNTNEITVNPTLLKSMTRFATRFDFIKEKIDKVEIEDMFLSLLGAYQSTEGILKFKSQVLIDEIAKVLEPFDIHEQPPLPRALREGFGLHRQNRGFSGNRNQNRFGGGNYANRRDDGYSSGYKSRDGGSNFNSGYKSRDGDSSYKSRDHNSSYSSGYKSRDGGSNFNSGYKSRDGGSSYKSRDGGYKGYDSKSSSGYSRPPFKKFGDNYKPRDNYGSGDRKSGGYKSKDYNSRPRNSGGFNGSNSDDF
ncbi:hypothetical protein BB559_000632 [Furculomyces boomerangus]|uniref:ATP-dependent RNA helicase n=2 Tax=Harpellales TaxID=61421 RepID=A0A2T9Z4H7_9FUNG|nr:hypothetical protein BB559_000632 [Furculomyces boomerangus]PVZ97015.1 hypothetical protein BB558_007060 [Smittium angustum]